MADDFVESLLEAPYKPEGDIKDSRRSQEDDRKDDKKKSSSSKHKKDSHRRDNEPDKSFDEPHSKKDKKSKRDRQKSKDRDNGDKMDIQTNGMKSSSDIKKKGHRSSRSRSKDRDHKRSKRSSRSPSKKHRTSSRSSSKRHHKRSTRSRSPKRRSHRKSRSRSAERRRSPTPVVIPADAGASSGGGSSRDNYLRRYNEEYERRNASRHGSTPPPRASDKDNLELSPEERDQRTVLFMQLGPYVSERDIMEFLKSVGKKTQDVRDIRLIVDSRTRRSKGLAYVEFKEPGDVQFALTLNGAKLKSRPIVVQHSQAEKNRIAALTAAATANLTMGGSGASNSALAVKGQPGPMKLYVGSLHPNITEEMLKGIFEPFGKIDFINLIMDLELNKSRGYGFIQFHDCEDAKRALESLNGFELAGKPMKVSKFNERLGISEYSPEHQSMADDVPTPALSSINLAVKNALGGLSQSQSAYSILDNERVEKTGIALGATNRLALMAKLAEGTGMKLPEPATAALNAALQTGPLSSTNMMPTLPPISTPAFMLANMFDPNTETGDTWHLDIADDVIEECDKYGGVLHIYVDRHSPTGNVYVKCATLATAAASVAALHGRFFAGKMITAAYIPLTNYHSLFPDSANAMQKVRPTSVKE